jgi:hypothetical protein
VREFVDGGIAFRSEVLREGGLAEDGDRITSRQIRLPGQTTTVDTVIWNHDPEATVLAQQVDAPQLWEATALTEFFELRCSGPLRDRAIRRSRSASFSEVLAADRDALVDLLEALHNARDLAGRPVYERVVIVGHHWGAAVARQAVQACWARRQARSGWPVEAGDGVAEAVAAVEAAAAKWRECLPARSPGSDGDPFGEAASLRSEYRQAQSALWRVLRDGSGPRRWIVSDLVTLGHPRGAPEAVGAMPVRWTNAWFSHADGAGPLARVAGPGVEDVVLAAPRLAAVLPQTWPGSAYWTATGRLAREGSRLSVALLRRLVRRRPTLLLRAPVPPAPERLQELAAAVRQAAQYPTARGAVLADVRLLVGAEPAGGHPFPVGAVPVPAAIALREVRSLLGEGGRVQVLLSSGLLPPLDPAG